MKTIFLTFAVQVFLASLPAFAMEDGMPNMPRIEPKRTYTIKSADEGETVQDDRGFGEKDSEVSMMNLMMVEGSGYEGMDMKEMGSMKMGGPKSSEHSMPGMKMESKTDEGQHSMSGMKMAADDTTTAADESKKSTHRYSVERKGTSDRAKVGTNIIEFAVQDSKTGKPAKGLKLKAEVSMSSMDMGIETPRVREPSPGTYQVKAAFAMKGPWAVKIILPGGEEETLSFNAEKSP